MKRIALTSIATLLLAGCVHGTWFEPDEIARDMKPGVTSYGDAVAMLGKPWRTERYEDGSRLVTWDGFKAPLHFGSNLRRLAVRFDPNGKMEKVEQMTAN